MMGMALVKPRLVWRVALPQKRCVINANDCDDEDSESFPVY